jgi:DNA-binding NarL/FixJ family response regulator
VNLSPISTATAAGYMDGRFAAPMAVDGSIDSSWNCWDWHLPANTNPVWFEQGFWRTFPVHSIEVHWVQLAELSGIDLQQRLTNGGENLPTIFITANDDPAMRERAESLSCVAYLRKTASGHELLQMIHSVLSKRGAQG